MRDETLNEFLAAWSNANRMLEEIGKEFGMTERQLQSEAERLRSKGIPLARRRF